MLNLQLEIKRSVGGFLGMGKTEFTAMMTFSKNEYYVGEQAQVRIKCDNSKCEKDIRNFKMKLLRTYSMRAVGAVGSHSAYVAQ